MADATVEYGGRVVIKNSEHNIGGAIMSIDAGKRTDMCFHLQNKKVLYLLSGKAKVIVIQDGKTRTLELNPGQSFFTQPGFMHQLEAVERSVVVEFPSDPNLLYDDARSDTQVIMKGAPAPQAPAEPEPGSAVLMTEEDKAAAVEEEEKPKTRRRRTTKKKTTKRASRSKS